LLSPIRYLNYIIEQKYFDVLPDFTQLLFYFEQLKITLVKSNKHQTHYLQHLTNKTGWFKKTYIFEKIH